MADPITWETLIKAVEDLTTIIEEIDAKLLTHNQDPSSHGQEGEVVEEHRSDEELDHPLGSLGLQYLSFEKFFLFTALESLDGWLVAGTFSASIFAAQLATQNIINDHSRGRIVGIAPKSRLKFSKDPFFQTSLICVNATNQLFYFGCGDLANFFAHEGFGFKVSNATLYAVTRIGANEFTTEIAGINIEDLNIYRAVYDFTEDEIRFYVNGVLKHTEETNVPDTDNQDFFIYYLKTLENDNKVVRIVDLLFEQDR